jgi:hypothetical protein
MHYHQNATKADTLLLPLCTCCYLLFLPWWHCLRCQSATSYCPLPVHNADWRGRVPTTRETASTLENLSHVRVRSFSSPIPSRSLRYAEKKNLPSQFHRIMSKMTSHMLSFKLWSPRFITALGLFTADGLNKSTVLFPYYLSISNV